ncbi:MAG: imidazole glycerol phosphate synthase subunit HisH, partial [Elusimicrobiota bacterium]|nr:imidazole glycerol phosphate synthase subunit HisH [Elusimicrobiota bacterium]
MIVIVNYNLGNIRSVENAFKKVGADISVSSNPEDIEAASGLVVPGVGAFKKASANLKELKIYDPIIKFIKNKKPYLGICLGFQLLFTESLEHGKNPGFDIFRGKVKRIKDKIKIPHMGWNSVYYSKDTPMFDNIPEGSYFYFDHSYYVDSPEEDIVSGRTAYGDEFISALYRENIWGTQFHPEKS